MTAEFEFDEGDGGNVLLGRGSEFKLDECRWCGFEWQGGGGLSPPVHERLVGYAALAAESGGASIVLFKLPDDSGLLLVGAACA